MSFPEVLLWRELRLRPGGFKFRRQYPVGGYISDFACLETRLVIEIDGEVHNRSNQPELDALKDAALIRGGFAVLRIPALSVLTDLNSSIEGVVARCRELGALHRPADGPPPRAGEDL